jgi:BirA family biotin operon repressor/biotin-[acetyl-CoA-carboxylase] ligase
LGRAWISERGVSLTMSLLMRHYAGHPRPWLLGMAVSLAVAKSVQGKVRWPNDVVKDGHKVAGVLTEVRTDARGRRVPIIGVGVNVLEAPFLKSLEQPAAAAAPSGDPQGLAEEIFEQMRSLPEPSSWAAISQVWLSLDDTPGKPYRLPTGELAVALRVGNDGSLLCTVDGQQRTALAADAVMGQ